MRAYMKKSELAEEPGGADKNQLLARNWIRRVSRHLGNGRRIIISSTPTQPLDVVDAGAFSLQAISSN